MDQDFTIVKHIDHLKAYKSFIGRTVSEISHCQYYYNDEPYKDEDCDLEFKFEDGSVLTFSILSDGESMIAKAEPLTIPESFDLGDNSHCSWRRILLNHEPIWKDITGAKLTDIESVIDHWIRFDTKVISGCRLSLSNGSYVVFMNIGDNSRFSINDVSLIENPDGAVTTFSSILEIDRNGESTGQGLLF